jgi:hypothetical protein
MPYRSPTTEPEMLTTAPASVHVVETGSDVLDKPAVIGAVADQASMKTQTEDTTKNSTISCGFAQTALAVQQPQSSGTMVAFIKRVFMKKSPVIPSPSELDIMTSYPSFEFRTREPVAPIVPTADEAVATPIVLQAERSVILPDAGAECDAIVDIAAPTKHEESSPGVDAEGVFASDRSPGDIPEIEHVCDTQYDFTSIVLEEAGAKQMSQDDFAVAESAAMEVVEHQSPYVAILTNLGFSTGSTWRRRHQSVLGLSSSRLMMAATIFPVSPNGSSRRKTTSVWARCRLLSLSKSLPPNTQDACHTPRSQCLPSLPSSPTERSLRMD